MSILETTIGWLAPPQCIGCDAEGLALCGNCFADISPFGERCWRCNRLSSGSRACVNCRKVAPLNSVWISVNYESLARELVQKFKFGCQRAAAKSLARAMIETFRGSDSYLVVPVATATSRMRERGFGHSELLAKTIAAQLNLEYCNALRRLGQSRQVGASRSQRLVQLRHSFAVKNRQRVAGRNILLVDDVLTTGGTLIVAAEILRAAGACRVDALVFAKRL